MAELIAHPRGGGVRDIDPVQLFRIEPQIQQGTGLRHLIAELVLQHQCRHPRQRLILRGAFHPSLQHGQVMHDVIGIPPLRKTPHAIVTVHFCDTTALPRIAKKVFAGVSVFSPRKQEILFHL